ncbi:MAG: hypothetical protein HY868_25355 [Chloroflexi bacterium]|nr:hypothetical protein [Chloroflexota bacterium]
MRLFIEPTDVWLFRDGRPFTAGADHRARTLFPPSPHTVAGALRAVHFAAAGISRAEYLAGQTDQAKELQAKIGKPPDANGDGGDLGAFALTALSVARRDARDGNITRYFPIPADVMQVGDALRVAAPLKTQVQFTSDNDHPLLWIKEMRASKPATGWLAEAELRRYLRGETFRATPDEFLFERESRFHVGIDSDRKCPREGDGGGHLFQIEWVRARENVGLAVEIAGADVSAPGALALGGELKSARYETLAPAFAPLDAPFDPRFKVYCATPALVDLNAWKTYNFFHGAQIELIAAAIARAQPLGGWDVAHNTQKPLRNFIPAGSVLYCKLARGTRDQIKQRAPITDDALGALGFGITFLGGWDYV